MFDDVFDALCLYCYIFTCLPSRVALGTRSVGYKSNKINNFVDRSVSWNNESGCLVCLTGDDPACVPLGKLHSFIAIPENPCKSQHKSEFI